MSDCTNDFSLQFLRAYHGEPILWEPKHAYHKDRKKVNDAWIRLSELLTTAIPILKKKKDSLMATFRAQLRRKNASISTGAGVDDDYAAIWFAFETMEVFPPVYECNTTINTQDTIHGTENEAVGFEIEANEETGADDYDGTLESALEPQPATRITVRRRGNPTELQEAGKQMQDAFDTLNNALRKRTDDDECDLYTKLLAKKMRRLPENERDLLMYEIDGLVMKRSTRLHHLTSPTAYNPSSPLPSPDLPSSSSLPNRSLAGHSSFHHDTSPEKKFVFIKLSNSFQSRSSQPFSSRNNQTKPFRRPEI